MKLRSRWSCSDDDNVDESEVVELPVALDNRIRLATEAKLAPVVESQIRN